MTNSHSATTTPASRLALIQEPIRERLDAVVDEIRRSVLSDFDVQEEVNDYLLQVRGKLFRPTLLLLTNEVGGKPSDDALCLGAVVEMVHLATLVHDDAVDHSVLRRGMPTVNHLWTHQVAIITGDFLYARSVMELARMGRIEPIRSLAEASSQMSVGELRQLTAHDSLDFSEADYLQLIACKTASLMAAASEIGALVGAPEHAPAFRRFGHALGMAFQMADDLLDYEGTEASTGKPVGHDLRERKMTLPLIEALRRLPAPDREAVREFFTRVGPSDQEIAEIIELVRGAGGLEYARREAREWAVRAEEALDEVGESGEAMEALFAAVTYAVERSR